MEIGLSHFAFLTLLRLLLQISFSTFSLRRRVPFFISSLLPTSLQYIPSTYSWWYKWRGFFYLLHILLISLTINIEMCIHNLLHGCNARAQKSFPCKALAFFFSPTHSLLRSISKWMKEEKKVNRNPCRQFSLSHISLFKPLHIIYTCVPCLRNAHLSPGGK
jgi:hypothetical protein